MPSAEFEQAAQDAQKFKSKPSNDDLLKLYALFKIAKDETPKQPGMLDFTGKAKYNAWKALKDEGKTADEAEQEYIKTVEEFKTTYGYEA